MGQFFKFMFASCLGVILAGVVLSLVSIGIMVQIAGQANKPKGVKPNTVLHLSLEQPVPEQTNNLEMNPFDFKNQYILGLSDMVQAIKHAKTDDRVQGIYLDMKQISLGSATAGALRQALLDFKTSGKFIYAYSDYYQQGTY